MSAQPVEPRVAHDAPHPDAGKSFVLNLHGAHPYDQIKTGDVFRVEDWWDHLTGGSWLDADGNPAALLYAMRAGFGGMPIDDEVVYGKVGTLGHLIHVSELGTEV